MAKRFGWNAAEAFDDEARANYGRSLYSEEARKEYGRKLHEERLNEWQEAHIEGFQEWKERLKQRKTEPAPAPIGAKPGPEGTSKPKKEKITPASFRAWKEERRAKE
jgi:hypothetical protein